MDGAGSVSAQVMRGLDLPSEEALSGLEDLLPDDVDEDFRKAYVESRSLTSFSCFMNPCKAMLTQGIRNEISLEAKREQD